IGLIALAILLTVNINVLSEKGVIQLTSSDKVSAISGYTMKSVSLGSCTYKRCEPEGGICSVSGQTVCPPKQSDI
ncbi:MAG TPA: hypothetical protein VE912_03700, partial [Bacteroidales bacterium]|nr:hypothetical protein [Bacteroidales bacterium]